MLQHERDEKIITDIERSEIESQIRIWEEESIEDFARKNCYLENIQSKLHPIAKETSSVDTLLRIEESLYEEGKINEEEIQKARKRARFQKEEYGARQRLADLLISANNYG